MRRSATTISSRTATFSSNGRMPRAFSIILISKSYVAQCEERHGRQAVEQTLDAAHALMPHGIDRYPGKKRLDLRTEEKRAGERRLHEESAFNDLWRTIPTGSVKSAALLSTERRRACSPGSASCSGSCGTSRSIFTPRVRPRS